MSTKISADEILAELKRAGVKGKEIARALQISPSAVTALYKGARQLKHEEARTLLTLIPSSAGAREFPVIGMAGAGAWLEAIEDSRTTVSLPAGAYPDVSGAFAVEVVGDSMNVVLPEGSFAIIDPEQNELFSGNLYLLRNGEGEATIKRYRSDPSRFEPMSDRPEFVPFLVGSTDFRVIGRVTGSLRKF